MNASAVGGEGKAAETTIFARASGAGKAGVAVYRLSGPDAFAIFDRLTAAPRPTPRTASVRRFVDPRSGHTLDEGLAILFERPASFTGEDVVEFHLHGSSAVERDLFNILLALGARPAAAGEFTKRALLAGKLDLAQVEGLADLLDAETSSQRAQALGQLGGRLSARADAWRGRLLRAAAQFEASIDFADEEDAPRTAAAARPELEALAAELVASEGEAARASVLREGVRIALIGAPNAGKSSLLNRLAGDDRAIVSDMPGTTRDLVEVRMDFGGRLASVIDTAGVRPSPADAIEREGVRRAQIAAEAANLRILLVNPFADVSRETLAMARAGDILVWTRGDLAGADAAVDAQEVDEADLRAFLISSVTGRGIDALAAAIGGRIDDLAGAEAEGALTRPRHVAAVTDARAAIARALARMDDAPELAAEDVRLAARALGRIVGSVGVEDVLGEIFSSFCIGK